MSVIDYTSSLTMGTVVESVNDKYCVLGADDVVTISFSCFLSSTATDDAVIAAVPSVLVANISNIFFTGYEETPNKSVVGGRIDSSGQMILNNVTAGAGYWIQVTYVRRTATE